MRQCPRMFDTRRTDQRPKIKIVLQPKTVRVPKWKERLLVHARIETLICQETRFAHNAVLPFWTPELHPYWLLSRFYCSKLAIIMGGKIGIWASNHESKKLAGMFGRTPNFVQLLTQALVWPWTCWYSKLTGTNDFLFDLVCDVTSIPESYPRLLLNDAVGLLKDFVIPLVFGGVLPMSYSN